MDSARVNDFTPQGLLNTSPEEILAVKKVLPMKHRRGTDELFQSWEVQNGKDIASDFRWEALKPTITTVMFCLPIRRVFQDSEEAFELPSQPVHVATT